MLSIYMLFWCMHAPLDRDHCNALVQERWGAKGGGHCLDGGLASQQQCNPTGGLGHVVCKPYQNGGEEEEELPALGADPMPAGSRERVSTPRVSTTRSLSSSLAGRAQPLDFNGNWP